MTDPSLRLAGLPPGLDLAVPPDFDGQWRLAAGPLPPDPLAGTAHAAREVALPSLSLQLWPRARLTLLRDAAGAPVGALIGTVVDPDAGRVLGEVETLPEPWAPETSPDDFAERTVLGRLSGTYLLILDGGKREGGPGRRRLYLDACGSRSAVFDAAAGLAAATAPALLGPQAAARFDAPLHAALNIEGEGWFPAGLTAHRGVTRVLTNHALDLDAWTQTRIWPRDAIPVTDDPEAACRVILADARATARALIDDRPCAMSLTAGNETRFLLAACRDFAKDIDFVTAEGPNADLDLHRAKELAARFGLRRRTLPRALADEARAAEWHARAGQAIGGGNRVEHPATDPLKGAGKTLIAGFGGEIGRAFFWRPGDGPELEVDADQIVPRFGMPANPAVRAAVEAWLPSIAHIRDPFLRLDLAYLELRMGCWAFAQAYVAPGLPEVSPMISRRCFQAMLSLPPDWRRGNRMILDSVRLAWPELLELPINRYGDWRDPMRLVRRAARNPGLILKRLRKRFG
ncbi:MAG: hypothetical protein AAFU61_00200 [Pseudomonadota bacterium]